jgi:hypothetical protein
VFLLFWRGVCEISVLGEVVGRKERDEVGERDRGLDYFSGGPGRGKPPIPMFGK